MRIVLVHGEQAPLAAPPNKHHAAAGAFAVPAVAFERRQAAREGGAQVGARRQLGGVQHVVEQVAEHEPAGEAGRGQGVVFAAFGGHAETVSAPPECRPTSSPRCIKLYAASVRRQRPFVGRFLRRSPGVTVPRGT
jgi:hypothetical protein